MYGGNAMMKEICGLTMDEERALYGTHGAHVVNCRFDGPADGESALKECGDIVAENNYYNLRYPFWHNTNTLVRGGTMTSLCRAAVWYCNDISLENVEMGGIKAVRECRGVRLSGCKVDSTEFGWFCEGLSMEDCTLHSEYPFMHSSGLRFKNLQMQGKYSFQYVHDMVIEDCELDTKDAFWHGRDILVKNSVVKGEYLAWYAENITFENCRIQGTQPFCYAKNIVLKNCEMVDCDLAFEYTSVDADIKGEILSVKNPGPGRIVADGYGEIILDEYQWKDARCQILTRGKDA